MAEQTEKAFQKQHLFQNTKSRGGRRVSTKTKRWYKDIGLGFKTPTGGFWFCATGWHLRKQGEGEEDEPSEQKALKLEQWLAVQRVAW